jgi:hypothetical protein
LAGDLLFDYCSDEGFALILAGTFLFNLIGISEIEKEADKAHTIVFFSISLYPMIFWAGYRRYLNWKDKKK